MSIETKGNGNLRLRCDVDGCERKFIPRRRLLEPLQLRLRAQLYGWSAAPASAPVVDVCPPHTKDNP